MIEDHRLPVRLYPLEYVAMFPDLRSHPQRCGWWFGCALALVVVWAAASRPSLAADAGQSVSTTARQPVVYMIGDSTMANKPTDPPNPEHGWGQLFPRYFKDPAMISNHARNGQSTKGFIDEGLWQKVADALQPGDWLIIQFAHNDEKVENPQRYAAPDGAFRDNLRFFVREARARGAHPILGTPVMRRRWNERGEFYDTHGDFPDAVRSVARELDVPLLDLHRLTQQLIEGHGVEGSKRLFLWIPSGVYARRSDGWQDDTHFSSYGADRVAALAVQEILRLGLPLADWLAVGAH